jgi:UDP-glucose 4-epimerase
MELIKVICLSTDKAAYPIRCYGISKAMMEKLELQEHNLANYGLFDSLWAIMASRGLIPLFFISNQKEVLYVTDQIWPVF